MPAAQTTVIPMLEHWCHLLHPGPSATRWDKILRFLIGSKVAFTITLLLFFPLITLNVLHQSTFKEMCKDGRMVLSCYSCMAGVAFFMNRRDRFVLLLKELLVLARSINETTSVETKVACDRVGRLCSFLLGLAPAYAAICSMSLFLPSLFTGHLQFQFWPWFTGTTGFYIALAMTMAFCLPLLLPAFYSLAVVVTINLSCANQFTAISNRLRELRGEGHDLLHEVVQTAYHHSQLVTICERVDDFMSTLVFHLTPALIAVPAVTTFLAVAGVIDFFSFVSLPYIGVFAVFCMTGQKLQNQSEGMVWAAYCSAWVEQPPATRKVILTMMTKANKPQGMSLMGFGRLTMTALREVLTSWFSYLNMMLKFL